MTIEAPFLMDAARLMGSQPGPDEMMRGWPLTARICVNRRDVAHLIDFPVLHLNAKGDHAFQIETGPVLLPASLFEHKKLGVGGFAIAFAFCNRLDRADLAIWSPISEGSAKRAYVHFARLEEVHIELYSGKNHSG